MKSFFRIGPALLVLFSAVAVVGVQSATTGSGSPALSDAAALELGRAYLNYQQELREIQPAAPPADRWWQAAPPALAADAREKLTQAAQKFHDTARGILKVEPVRPSGRDPRYAFLPEAKQEQVARIDQAHTDRLSDIRREFGQSRLVADVQHLQKLNADRERALAAVLTPAEREMLELRNSPAATILRQRYGELIESEAEFRKLYALQKAFEEKFSQEEIMYSNRPADVYRQRSEAEHKLLADMCEVVGEARATAFRRAIDQDYLAVSALCRRLNLPLTAAEEVMKIRESYAQQTMTISAETSLSFSDKRSFVQGLAKDAQKEVAAVLGKEALEAYLPRSTWLRHLESGMTFSTNAKDAMSSGTMSSPSQGVYYVSPSTTIRTSAGTTTSVTSTRPTPPAADQSKAPAKKAGTENSVPAPAPTAAPEATK
jgi:hypothetical protein